MTTNDSGPAPRVYRITPWAIRICVPLVALAMTLGLTHDGVAPAIPIPIVLGAAWLYAAERCGLVITTDGIESRMTRRENTFRYPWSEIEGFELVDNGAQVAIAMRLRDGSRRVLPSTRAWAWNKRRVTEIEVALLGYQAASTNAPAS